MPEFDSTIWHKDIPGFPDYRLGTDGIPWSCRGKQFKSLGQYPVWKKIATACTIRDGRVVCYPHFNVYRDNKRFTGHVHILMLETFIGPRPDGMECCHEDGNPLNNMLTNLRWDTPVGNAKDTKRLGRHWSPFRGNPKVLKAWKSKAESLLATAGFKS